MNENGLTLVAAAFQLQNLIPKSPPLLHLAKQGGVPPWRCGEHPWRYHPLGIQPGQKRRCSAAVGVVFGGHITITSAMIIVTMSLL